MMPGKPRAMVVAGVMSGTSADGVDVALVHVGPGKMAPRVRLLGHRGFAYPKVVKAAVLAAMDAQAISVAELARLNWRLGGFYAECVEKTCAALEVQAELVGMHGQTVYHQGRGARYAGAMVRATWQIGEASVMRERLGIPVVSDFRPADLAAGGQGAPLVPMLDWCVYRSAKAGRVLLNLGGIANVTVLPAGCEVGDVVAYDTGPANMVMDALMLQLFGRAFDRNGAVAARGKAVPGVMERVLRMPYFSALPPKSCGREQFGEAFTARFLELCGGVAQEDIVRTAAEVTVRSVADAVLRTEADELLVSGGGVRNALLMRRLMEEMPSVRVSVLEAPQAKEAVAFGLLAWLSWFGLHGNVASATGAAGGRVLGKISWGSA